MRIEELIKDVFNFGYYSYHECNTDADYSQNLKECISEFKDYNDNWTEIKSEEDLPKISDYYFIIVNNEVKVDFWVNYQNKFELWNKNSVTHYKIIEKPNHPKQ